MESLKIINLDKALSLEFQFRNDALLGGWVLYLAKSLRGVSTEFSCCLLFSSFRAFVPNFLTEFQFCYEVLSGFPSFPALMPSFFAVSSSCPSFPVFKPSYLAVFPVSRLSVDLPQVYFVQSKKIGKGKVVCCFMQTYYR